MQHGVNLNRRGFELTPRSWTILTSLLRHCSFVRILPG